MAKGSLSIGWCDNGTTTSLFTSALMSLYINIRLKNIKFAEGYQQIGNQIHKQRQELFENWERDKSDWLLWLDSDIVMTPEMFDKLWSIADEKKCPVISGVYYILDKPVDTLPKPMPCVFESDVDGNAYLPLHDLPENSLIEVDSIGMGAVLMHKSVQQKLKNKFTDGIYFDVALGERGRSEDFSFCKKLKEVGVPIHVHTGVQPSHIKQLRIDKNYYTLWWEVVAPTFGVTKPPRLKSDN